MKKRISLDLDHPAQAALVGKALSSPIRLKLLRSLVVGQANISELAERFQLPLSSAALHVRVLEKAGLVRITERPGVRGAQKLCSLDFDELHLDTRLTPAAHIGTRSHRYAMPIGCYFDCAAQAPCGIVTDKKYLGIEDVQSGFYSAERAGAQLIWLTTGYLEYRFPNHPLKGADTVDVTFTFEICSEAPGSHMNWPSDVTVWINGREICTLFCTGDYGDRRGAHTPEWWAEGSSQYGDLRSVSVRDSGCFADNIAACDETPSSLGLSEGEFISLRIGVKADAAHAGGFNLFGERFGDYRQGIVMRVKNRIV